MEIATEKQIKALKGFAKYPRLSEGILGGVDFDKLSKGEASDLIGKCKDALDGESPAYNGEFKIRFSQAYQTRDGPRKTVALSEEELAMVRAAHAKHCQEIMMECEEDYPNDSELLLAMFDKRCDKVFTWIQQALAGKYH